MPERFQNTTGQVAPGKDSPVRRPASAGQPKQRICPVRNRPGEYNEGTLQFHLYALRFHFTALEPFRFPAGKPANVLRGAFGQAFRKLVCRPECPGVETCPYRLSCPYARLFEPSRRGEGPSGLADWPRPFVFRAHHLDGALIPAGGHFHFDLHIFETRDPGIPHFIQAFAYLAQAGFGPRRSRARLDRVDELNHARQPARQLYDAETGIQNEPGAPLEFSLMPPEQPVHRLQVRFLSPTELKADRKLARRPEFWILFNRARDRISTLRTLYQEGPLPIDFRGSGQRAGQVRMVRCEIFWREVTRRSARTRQRHPLGGFVGEASYEGEITEFYPFLYVAQWTGVGRHTVWGNGVIEIRILDDQ